MFQLNRGERSILLTGLPIRVDCVGGESTSIEIESELRKIFSSRRVVMRSAFYSGLVSPTYPTLPTYFLGLRLPDRKSGIGRGDVHLHILQLNTRFRVIRRKQQHRERGQSGDEDGYAGEEAEDGLGAG